MKTALLLTLLPSVVLSAVHTATDAQGVYLGNEFRALLPRFSTSRSSLFQDFVLIRLLCAGSHDLTLLLTSHLPSPPSLAAIYLTPVEIGVNKMGSFGTTTMPAGFHGRQATSGAASTQGLTCDDDGFDKGVDLRVDAFQGAGKVGKVVSSSFAINYRLSATGTRKSSTLASNGQAITSGTVTAVHSTGANSINFLWTAMDGTTPMLKYTVQHTLTKGAKFFTTKVTMQNIHQTLKLYDTLFQYGMQTHPTTDMNGLGATTETVHGRNSTAAAGGQCAVESVSLAGDAYALAHPDKKQMHIALKSKNANCVASSDESGGFTTTTNGYVLLSFSTGDLIANEEKSFEYTTTMAAGKDWAEINALTDAVVEDNPVETNPDITVLSILGATLLVCVILTCIITLSILAVILTVAAGFNPLSCN